MEMVCIKKKQKNNNNKEEWQPAGFSLNGIRFNRMGGKCEKVCISQGGRKRETSVRTSGGPSIPFCTLRVVYICSASLRTSRNKEEHGRKKVLKCREQSRSKLLPHILQTHRVLAFIAIPI